jgi:carbon-monoxide dehydrogenase small subunit
LFHIPAFGKNRINKKIMPKESRDDAERVIAFELNGKPVSLSVPVDSLLLDVLRNRLGLTGTKKGCGIGHCGTCTVLLNGNPIYSCLTLAATVDGCKITTIEGLTHQDGSLNPVQQAFVETGAIQCGFCTPGMILTVQALLDENPHATREDVITAISGNLCRCTGYAKIIEAAIMAATQKI